MKKGPGHVIRSAKVEKNYAGHVPLIFARVAKVAVNGNAWNARPIQTQHVVFWRIMRTISKVAKMCTGEGALLSTKHLNLFRASLATFVCALIAV